MSATIKPEAGKRYVMRNGLLTGVISLASTHAYDNRMTWGLDGTRGSFTMHDLVEVASADCCDDIPDPVNQPNHYRAHPSGIECIQITEHMGFNLGNAVKYIWRCDLKADDIEDLRKAAWYIQREIDKRLAACAGELVK